MILNAFLSYVGIFVINKSEFEFRSVHDIIIVVSRFGT